jgi:all-trans-8'-apo-beta-carotenal 15,15'-oxygenase
MGTPYSAHPCWDPATAELWNFGCHFGPRGQLKIYRTQRGTPTEHVRTIKLPHRYMVHHFAMTATHLVFCLGPVILDTAALMSGRSPVFSALRWHEDKPTRILIVPRGPGPVRAVEADPWFQWHFAGAYDDGPDIVFDLVRFRSWTAMHEAVGSIGHLTDPASFLAGRLWRHRVGPTGKIESHQLHALPLEWPTIDQRRSTTTHRNVYGAATATMAGGLLMTAVARYDTERGEADIHDYGPGHLVSEPLFVPRAPDVLDEQGWLIANETHIASAVTTIAIFNAQAVGDGPVCTIPVPDSLGLNFHGQWVQRP